VPLLLVPAAGLYVALGSPGLYPSPKPPVEPRALPIGVSASGRLAPQGEVIAVAPGSGADGGRIDRLLVAVGDRVHAGQVVAVLDTYGRRLAAVREARAGVVVSQTKVAQVQAGAKAEDVRAQEMLIRRYRAELQAAERDLGRSSLLLKKAACSRQEFDEYNLKYEQARESLNQANAQLDAMKAVRPADLRVAEAELSKSEASLEVAQAELAAAEVRAPTTGRVLRIQSWPGERVGEKGIVEVGDTDVMYAVAEVYEEDAGKVHAGQPAKVRVPTLGSELSGEVVRKDLVVARKVIFNNDPVADIDARVIEVHIRLSPHDSPKVAGLSNARVEVVIDVSGGAK